MNLSESVHYVLTQEETLADLFYLVFLKNHPEVRRHFEKVDLKRQAVVLNMILLVLERHHAHAYPAITHFLRQLGAKHYLRKVKPNLYPKFRAALLLTLERFLGKHWTPGLALEWTECIDMAVQTMLEGYPKRQLLRTESTKNRGGARPSK